MSKQFKRIDRLLLDTMPSSLSDSYYNAYSKAVVAVVVDEEKLGRLLRCVREKQGVSLRAHAKRLLLSAPYLSDLELGRRRWSRDLVAVYLAALPVEPTPFELVFK